MGRQRVDLRDYERVVRERAWACGNPAHWRYREVAYGTVAGGRWFVARVGHRSRGEWLVGSEREACEVVEAWMAQVPGVWERIPAGWNELNEPDDGETWHRVGGTRWVLGPAPEGHDPGPRPTYRDRAGQGVPAEPPTGR